MSLQSRIQVAGQDGTEVDANQEPGKPAPERASVVSDPFADLKTRVHKDIIARLGPRLFNGDASKGDNNDLEATVNEAVTEVLALEMKVEFEVPVEREVAVSVNRGVPIVLSNSRSGVGKAMQEIADKLVPQRQAGKSESGGKKFRRRG